MNSRVIVRRQHGRWRAWFSHQRASGVEAQRPRDAIARLLKAHQLNFSPDELTSCIGQWDEDGFELQLPSCHDCRGSGQYVGFTVVEACATCGGSGLGQFAAGCA